MDKPIAGIAAFLQAGSAFMFFAAGAFGPGDAALLLGPALASGAAGLMLWGRAVRSDAGQRREPPAVPPPSSRVEEILAGLQEDVAQLREDREFYRALYGNDAVAERSLPGRSRPERG